MATAEIDYDAEQTARPSLRATPQEFDPKVFETLADVPIFAEHSTRTSQPDSDGNTRELVFTPTELQQICDRCNRRIEESGDYAAVTIGHTPDPEDVKAGKAQWPPVVGFAGPFRMGSIGKGDRRRAAILADLHIYHEEMDQVRRNPRRSPELWLEDKYEDMFLDPIALLGAEAPRLDLGLLYSARRHGRQIEKYAAAMPSGGNTFIPGDSIRKPRYAAGESAASSQSKEPGMAANLSTEDIQQIVDAIEQTAWCQWVKSQMGAEDGPGAPGSPAPEAAGGGEQAAPPPEEDPAKQKNAAGCNGMRKPYGAGAADTGAVEVTRGTPGKEDYALSSRLKRLESELAIEREKRTNAERTQEIFARRQYLAFDEEREVARCKYGRMSDEQFAAHLEAMDENYQRIPHGEMIPTFTEEGAAPVGSPTGRKTEKYSKELSKRARDVCEKAALRGECPDYGEVLGKLQRGEKVD